jgi:RNA polymerase sigma-70 factor (ECF subfamily)
VETISVLPVEGDGCSASDEPALVDAARTDATAFGTLYQRYLARIYRYLRIHSHSDEDAADLTQQVFLRALAALPTYRERGAPFGAWLFRIARHAAIDARRRERSMVAWDALPAALQPSSAHDPEAAAIKREALARLGEVLIRLDKEQRELLALRFAARLSAPEIAIVVGKSPAAVKKQLTRLIHSLREQYHGA